MGLPRPKLSERRAQCSNPIMQLNSFLVKLTLSVIVYWTVVSSIPIYNQSILKGFDGRKKYDYPLAVSFLQLVSTVVLLAIMGVIKHFFDKPGTSWVFGPHFLHKLKFISPSGVIFGIKLGLTNYGLSLLPINVHLLLQSSSLFWTMVFSYIAVREKPTRLELLALAGTIGGTIMIAINVKESFDISGGAAAFALIINLSSCVFEGAAITYVRYGTAKLFRPQGDEAPMLAEPLNANNVASEGEYVGVSKGASFTNGEAAMLHPVASDSDGQQTEMQQATTTPDVDMDSFEFTLIKLTVSAITVLPFLIIFETFDVANQHDGVSFGEALDNADKVIVAMLMTGGGVLTLIFQVNVTYMTTIVSAIATGVVGDVKIVPQTFASWVAYRTEFTFDALHVSGLVVSCVSVGFYGALRLRHYHNSLTPKDADSRERLLLASEV